MLSAMDAPLLSQEHLLSDPVSEKDHAIGSADAPLTIVEYGDYECPTCLNAVPIIDEIRKSFGPKLRFVFRHFPQSSIHPHAGAAAEAAEAAADQGKFWEMHAALFEKQKTLSKVDFSHLGLKLGLEIYRFETSRARGNTRIRRDLDSGERSGVTKTPTLFINGNRYEGKLNTASILSASIAVMAGTRC